MSHRSPANTCCGSQERQVLTPAFFVFFGFLGHHRHGDPSRTGGGLGPHHPSEKSKQAGKSRLVVLLSIFRIFLGFSGIIPMTTSAGGATRTAGRFPSVNRPLFGTHGKRRTTCDAAASASSRDETRTMIARWWVPAPTTSHPIVNPLPRPPPVPPTSGILLIVARWATTLAAALLLDQPMGLREKSASRFHVSGFA